MVDFVYPSIFGIGASVLFIVLMIACCVRWLRLYKLQHSNVVSTVCDETTGTGSSMVNPHSSTTAGRSGYHPPPYSIRMTPPGQSSSAAAVPPPGYFNSGYFAPPYPPMSINGGPVAQQIGSDSTMAQQQQQQQRPVTIGVNSFNHSHSHQFSPNTVGDNVVPAPPPSYYDDRPPSYDDVVAAGKAITVPKFKKDGDSSDSGGQNR